jgi:hypothetical protein
MRRKVPCGQLRRRASRGGGWGRTSYSARRPLPTLLRSRRPPAMRCLGLHSYDGPGGQGGDYPERQVISPEVLKQRLDAGEDVTIIDTSSICSLRRPARRGALSSRKWFAPGSMIRYLSVKVLSGEGEARPASSRRAWRKSCRRWVPGVTGSSSTAASRRAPPKRVRPTSSYARSVSQKLHPVHLGQAKPLECSPRKRTRSSWMVYARTRSRAASGA